MLRLPGAGALCASFRSGVEIVSGAAVPVRDGFLLHTRKTVKSKTPV